MNNWKLTYQSWKQLMHKECPQLGNTIFALFSMHIPHSSSLSKSLSDSFLWPSILFLLKTSALLLLLWLSSTSINSPSSCLREGYMIAERIGELKALRGQTRKKMDNKPIAKSP
jgi:hypothetical protein